MARKLSKTRIKKRVSGFRKYLLKAYTDYPTMVSTPDFLDVLKKLERIEKKCCR
jgi:hypothetical protein